MDAIVYDAETYWGTIMRSILSAGIIGLKLVISLDCDNVNTLLFEVFRFKRRRFSFLRRISYRSISVNADVFMEMVGLFKTAKAFLLEYTATTPELVSVTVFGGV